MLLDNEINQLVLTKPKNSQVREMTDVEKERIEVITRNSYSKKKYRMALEVTTKMMVQDVYAQHPDWSVRDVLTTMLKEYNKDLPSTLLLEMTQLIVNEWEKKQTHKSDLALA
jgi:CBS-domain-containing membrane protein